MKESVDEAETSLPLEESLGTSRFKGVTVRSGSHCPPFLIILVGVYHHPKGTTIF